VERICVRQILPYCACAALHKGRPHSTHIEIPFLLFASRPQIHLHSSYPSLSRSLALSDHFGVRLRMERTCGIVTFVLIAWAAFSAVLENDVVAILLLYVQVPEPLHVVDALDGSVRTGACLLVLVTVVTPMRSGPTSCAGQDMTASPGGVLNVQLFCKKLTAHIVASGKKRTEIAIIEAV
jgi:hypothetical protein